MTIQYNFFIPWYIDVNTKIANLNDTKCLCKTLTSSLNWQPWANPRLSNEKLSWLQSFNVLRKETNIGKGTSWCSIDRTHYFLFNLFMLTDLGEKRISTNLKSSLPIHVVGIRLLARIYFSFGAYTNNDLLIYPSSVNAEMKHSAQLPTTRGKHSKPSFRPERG